MPIRNAIDRSDFGATSVMPGEPVRRRPRVLAASAAALAILAGTVLAQDALTPERLAKQVPTTWYGVEAAETNAGIDASGAAFASAHYDDEDERSSRDLSLGITDLGPYRNAALLVYEADVAEGRLERLDIAGHPAFAAAESDGPALDVIAGRMWLRASSFGELYDVDALRAAVESLPLDEIAALSESPTSPEASHVPMGFTRGALRSFLPEAVLGLPRADGFYARVHPTGVAWGGFPYLGERNGDEVRLRVGIWDLGTIADAARERLADAPEAWQSFTLDGRQGYAEVGAKAPRVVLFADRFRVQVEAPGHPTADTEWLRGAFEAIDLARLERLAEWVPAPTPARDPLRGQPDMLDSERLAEALPADLAGRSRGEVQAQVQTSRSDPFDTSLARATYAGGDGEPEWTLEVRDQGLLTHDLQQDLAEMHPAELGGRTVWTHDSRPMAAILVADRVLVALYAWGEEPAGVGDVLAAALAGLDVEPLQAAAASGD